MYLLDTNIWLERLLGQDQSESVGQFLKKTPAHLLVVTDFTLHSIGLILTRLDQSPVLLQFIQDVFIDGAVQLKSLAPQQMRRLVAVMDKYSLDFDDAYQYVVAELENYMIVSFDKDFDQTELGRRTPSQILAERPDDQ